VDRVRSSRRLYVDTDSASTYAFVRARVDNILKSVSVFRRIRAAIDCLRLLADKYSSGWNMPTFGLDDADPDGDRFFGCTGTAIRPSCHCCVGARCVSQVHTVGG
jgi:hypothetical protein